MDPTVYELIHAGDRRAMPSGALGPVVGIEKSEIADRCVLAMINEAVRCLEEGILRSPRDGDIGAVFGLGFPPFRGGPFRYIDANGIDGILSQLDTFDGRYSDRFRPAPLLIEMARQRTRFYPAEGRPV